MQKKKSMHLRIVIVKQPGRAVTHINHGAVHVVGPPMPRGPPMQTYTLAHIRQS